MKTKAKTVALLKKNLFLGFSPSASIGERQYWEGK